MAMRPLPTQMTQIIVPTTYFEFLFENGHTMALYLRHIKHFMQCDQLYLFDYEIDTVGNTDFIE